jgi:hypothetical protein
MFTLQFATGNDDFAKDPAGTIAVILDQVADFVEYHGNLPDFIQYPIRDRNGNTIGRWSYQNAHGRALMADGTPDPREENAA